LLEIWRVAFWVPATVGAKVTPIVQAPLTATVEQLLVSVKFAATTPVRLTAFTINGVVPVFVNVIVIGTEVVPWVRSGKTSELVESDTRGLPPVPASWMTAVFPLTSEVAVMEPVKLPTVLGVKATLNEHVWVELAGHVDALVTEKLLEVGADMLIASPIGPPIFPFKIEKLCAPLVVPTACAGKVM
jgi:hypothetical protein